MNAKLMRNIKESLVTILSIVIALVWIAPLFWLVGTAFTKPSFKMTFLPNTAFTLDNLKYVWNAIPFGKYYINTLILVIVIIIFT